MADVKEEYKKIMEKMSKYIGNQKRHRQTGGVYYG